MLFTTGRFTLDTFTGAESDAPPAGSEALDHPVIVGILPYGGMYGLLGYTVPAPRVGPVYVRTTMPPSLTGIFSVMPYGFWGYGGTSLGPAPPEPVYGLSCRYGYYPYGGGRATDEDDPTRPGAVLHAVGGLALGLIGGYAARTLTATGGASPIVPTRAIPKRPPVVYVLDDSRRFLAAIDAYEVWEWTAHWRHPHEARLVLNAHLPVVDLLTAQGAYLMAWTESGDLRIAEIESIDGDVGGEGAGDDRIEVTGRDYSRHFEGRVALTKTLSGDGYDTWTKTRGTAAEAMAYFVRGNALEYAEPNAEPEWSLRAEYRVLNLLELGDVPEVNARVDYAARFQYLSEILYEIGLEADLGYQVRYDRARDRFVFDVLAPRDPDRPVRLSFEGDSLSRLQWRRSVRDHRTYAVAAGQGEGAERFVGGTYDTWRVPAAGPFPANEERHELFIDARDCATTGDVQKRALNRLQEFLPEQWVEVGIPENGLVRYPDDVRLGDLVSVHEEPHAEMTARLIGVRERYDPEDGRTLEFLVGSEPGDLISRTAGLNRRRGSIYRI